MKNLTLGISTLLFCTAANATYIDYRHEWLGDEHRHEDRVKIGHSMQNGTYFSLEGKWRSRDGGFGENLSSKGNEVEVGYKYKATKDFVLTPSFALDSGDKDTAYKFSAKAAYNLTDDFNIGTRLRYGVRHYDNSNKPKKDNQHYWQSNFYLGYKLQDFSLSYDFEYKFNTDYPAYKGKEKDYAHNLNVSWVGNKTWVPYVELGYVSYDDGSYVKNGQTYRDAWQWRYRVGIAYNF